MSRNTLKQLNRGAIWSSLLVWLTIQFTQLLKPLGIPIFSTRPLVIAGLIAIAVLVWWPWLKGSSGVVDDHSEQSPKERQHQILVSFEIVALSAMLISLLVHL